MRRLRILALAAVELDELNYHGIRTYGERQATAYYRALQRQIEQLVEHPFMHRERDDVRPPIRLIHFSAHNVFYDVTDVEAIVTRVLHYSADWKNLL